MVDDASYFSGSSRAGLDFAWAQLGDRRSDVWGTGWRRFARAKSLIASAGLDAPNASNNGSSNGSSAGRDVTGHWGR